MRIEKNWTQVVGERQGKEKINPPHTNQNIKSEFQTQLAKVNQREVKERLDKLLQIIDEQGQKLKRSLDKKDLLEYKRRVRDFLRIIQEEFARAKQSFSWDSWGNLRTYTIIEKIDQNLEVLHELFLSQQADALEVLKKVDEIRGLLLDLYI